MIPTKRKIETTPLNVIYVISCEGVPVYSFTDELKAYKEVYNLNQDDTHNVYMLHPLAVITSDS